jgi:hypothetical protein
MTDQPTDTARALPRYVERRQTKSGPAYYYNAPAAGCPVRSQPLGTDYHNAVRYAEDVLSSAYDDWRAGSMFDCLRYVHRYVDCRGKVRFYFRRRGQKDVVLKGTPDSPQFKAQYHALLRSKTTHPIRSPDYDDILTWGDVGESAPISSSMVYVIGPKRADRPVKIGISALPQRRLADLQTSHHDRLTILAQTPGGRDEESALHRLFKRERLNGEWFQRSPEIEKFIALIGRRGLPVHLAVKWIADDRRDPRREIVMVQDAASASCSV